MSTNGSKYYLCLLHIALWTAVLGIPFFSPRPGQPLHGGVDIARFIPVLVSFMIVFYVNYVVLIKKYMYTRKFGKFIFWNIVLIAVASALVHLTFRLFYPGPADLPPAQAFAPRPILAGIKFTLRNTVIYMAIVCAAIAVQMSRKWYEDENKRKDIEKIQAETELAGLKSQINPHFLFNTLNNIYSLIMIDQDKAQGAVHDLSGMMRYLLYESEQSTVSLSKETAFLKDYIKLMCLRLSSRVKVDVSLPGEESNRQIAPMLFLPLVENAFKHGVSDNGESFIRIDLKEDGDQVVCIVENSNHPKDDNDRSGSGIGIRNLQRRLDMLYPDEYSFEFGNDAGTYRSTMIIKTSNGSAK